MIKFPPKTILVPFDFTQRSLHAWKYAQALSQRVGACLRAIYVSPWRLVPEGVLVPPTLSRAERAEIEKKLARVLGQSGAARIAEGDIVPEILKAAKTCRADLIVMATEGRTGLRRMVLGSSTEALVRVSPVPVLSLRKAARLPRSLLAPVNLQPYSIAGFHFAEEVAKTLQTPVTILHVAKGPAAETAPLRRLELAATDARYLLCLDVKLKVAQGKPVAKIIEESAKHDLVVLVAHRSGIFHDGILGTTAERVLRSARAPVLSVPLLAASAATPPRGRQRGRMRRFSAPRPGARRGRATQRAISWKM